MFFKKKISTNMRIHSRTSFSLINEKVDKIKKFFTYK